MRKRHLGILIFLLGIFLAGCSEIKSQDISSFQGISIAHRGVSRITPITGQNSTGEQSENEGHEQDLETPQAIENGESEIATLEVVESSTETPTNEDITTSITPTQTSKNILESTHESDSGSICSPEYNQNFETEVIRLINAEREKESLPPLSEHALLTKAARLHSEDMACNQFFSHISPSNGDVDQRMELQNYNYSAIGENIAAGYDSPESVVQGWMNSTGHRANILCSTCTQIGVGYIFLEGSTLEVYWTVILGTP